MALVVVAQAEYDEWEPLTQVPQAAGELADALTENGYELHLPHLLSGGTRAEVVDALDQWLRGLSEHDRLLLYWTGHGTGNGTHYLVTRDSPRQAPTTARAMPTRDLGDLIAQSKVEKALVILDTCFSSGGAQGIANDLYEVLNARTDLPGQVRFAAVLPSVNALQRAQEAIFCRTLQTVLTDAGDTNRTWSDQDQFIPISQLFSAMHRALQEVYGKGWQPPRPGTVGIGDLFLPNPRFRGPQPAIDVESRRRSLQIPEALALAARGIEAGEAGWYFTGRSRILGELVRWLEADEGGLTVLTGPAGAGKSAVIGRLVTLSDPESRRTATEARALTDVSEADLPPEGILDVVVHAKGSTRAECARAITRDLGVELPPSGGAFDPTALVDAIRPLRRRPTLVVDALDEAVDSLGIGAMLRRLADEADVRVLVGCRYSPDGRALLPGEDRHGRLRAVFGNKARILDLENEPGTTTDIADYVARRLHDTRPADDPEGIHRVAQVVAEKADGVFLYARVVARTLQDAESLDGDLPATATEAFVRDLQLRFGDRRTLVDELLRALAWGEGGGLSRWAWAPVATALSPAGTAYDDTDVAWMLDHAGWHILQAGEAGQTVYRLAHQAFTDHYGGQLDDTAVIQRRIAQALTQDIAGTGWFDADPYLWRHLADHAAAGSVLDPVVRDVGFLAVADPIRLLPALERLTEPVAHRVASLYRRAADRIAHAGPVERMALIHLGAHQEDPDLAARVEPLLRPRWRCRWAWWERSVPSTLATRLDARVSELTTADVPDIGPIAVAAVGEKLRGWALETLSELPGSGVTATSVSCLTSAVIDGRSVLVAGTSSGGLHAFFLPDLEKAWERTSAHEGDVYSVVILHDANPPLVASCGQDGSLALWRLPGLEPVRRRANVAVHAYALSLVTLGNRQVLVSCGDTARTSDPDMKPIAVWSVPDLKLLSALGDEVNAVGRPVCVLDFGGDPVLIGSTVISLGCWSLRTSACLEKWDREPANQLMPLGSSQDRGDVLVSADGRLKKLTMERLAGNFFIRSSPLIDTTSGRWKWTGPVSLRGRSYLVSAADEVRLWDIADVEAAIAAAPPATTDEMFRQQQVRDLGCVVGVDDTIWCGSDAGWLYCWSADGDQILALPSTNRGQLVALDVVEIQGRVLLVAGFSWGTVQVFDTRSRQALPVDIRAGGQLFDLATARSGTRMLLATATSQQPFPHGGPYQVRLWELPSGREIDTTHTDPFSEESKGWRLSMGPWEEKRLTSVVLAPSPHGKLIIAAGDLPFASAWNAETTEEVLELSFPKAVHEVTSLAAYQVGEESRVAAGTENGGLIAWELNHGQQILHVKRAHRPSEPHGVHVADVWWRERYVIASGGGDGVVRIWSHSGALLTEFPLGAPVRAITSLTNGDLAVTTVRGLVVVSPS